MARILVVDDEEGLREFLSETLQDDGHDTTEAGDGARALEVVREEGFVAFDYEYKHTNLLNGEQKTKEFLSVR